MKKLIILIVGVAVVAAAVYGGIMYEKSQSAPVSQSATDTSTTTAATSTTQSTLALDKTYTNSKLSFSIKYPSIAVPSPSDGNGYLPLTQTSLTSFTLPRSMFAGTNLVEAGVYVGATTSPQAMTSCTSAAGMEGETAQGTQTINGADFQVSTASGAGAGNFYDSKIYRRIENGWCVEVVEMLHSGNIANYPSGTVKEFDKTYYQDILESIVHSYQSIPTGV